MNPILHICTSSRSIPTIVRLLEALVDRGFEIHLACAPGPEFEELQDASRVRCHPLEMTRTMTPSKDALAVLEARELIRSIRPRIVHAHNPKGGLVGMSAARLCGVAHRFYHVHGLPYVTRKGPRRAVYRRAEQATLRLSTHAFCVSPSVRTQLLQDRLVGAQKVSILGRGSSQGALEVDQDSARARGRQLRHRLGIAEDALVILYLGRLHVEKGLAELEQAWLELRAQFKNAELMIVGEADSVAPYFFDSLRRDTRVHQLGFLHDVEQAFGAADLFVLPSYREGLPLSVIEASAHGLPVVATQSLGCVDAVRSDETGILVPAFDVEALISALARLLQSSELRSSLGEAGRKWVIAEFAPSRIVDELARIYEEALRD